MFSTAEGIAGRFLNASIVGLSKNQLKSCILVNKKGFNFLKEKTHPKANWKDSQILWVLTPLACSRTTSGCDLSVS